jgi:hypothetical protein
MTTKPKTRKPPARAPGVNPKLIALAAKIDEAKAYSDSLDANDQEDQRTTLRSRRITKLLSWKRGSRKSPPRTWRG